MRSLNVTIALSIVIIASRGCYGLILHKPMLARQSHIAVPSTERGRLSYHSSWRSTNKASSSMMSTATSDVTPEDTRENKPESSVLTGCKVIYFGIPGRGEAIRLALAIGGVKFEDTRIPFPAWGRVKPTTPWGTLPVLELSDGVTQLAQSRSVLRFVGKHTGLYPTAITNDQLLVAQKIDELMDALEDLGAAITNVGQGLPKEELETARFVAVSDGGTIYNLLAKIDACIEANGIGSGYAVGTEINIASILTFTTLGRLVGGVFFGVPPTVCDPFPNIQLVRKTVGSHPAVVAWYNARFEQQKSQLSPAEQILMGCRDM